MTSRTIVYRMWFLSILIGSSLGLMIAGVAAAGEAESEAPSHSITQDPYVSDDWAFSLTPYLWAISLDGDVTVRGQKSDVDVGFDKILEDLNFAVMLEGEVRKGRFGLFVNPVYATLEDSQSVSGTKIDADIDLGIVAFGGYYRLGPWNLDSSAGAKGPRLVTDIYAGGRYNHLKLDLDIEGAPNADGSQDWVDPIIGLRTIWDLSPRWSASLSGDYGGFNVGSDYQWQATGLVGYRFRLLSDDNARIFAGYRYLRQDYDDGSGTDKFEWDVKLHGPVLGLSWHF